jgi:hypothetical protein
VGKRGQDITSHVLRDSITFLPPAAATSRFITYEERYGRERAADSELDKALRLLEEAQAALDSDTPPEEIVRYGG